MVKATSLAYVMRRRLLYGWPYSRFAVVDGQEVVLLETVRPPLPRDKVQIIFTSPLALLASW